MVFFLESLLLTEAEDRLNILASEMEHPDDKDLAQCSAGDLEMMVKVRLQLAAIALQRHQAAYRQVSSHTVSSYPNL